MKLSPYIETLQKSLEAAAAPGGEEVERAAALLTLAIESAAKLSLIEALTDASEEITASLSEAAVEPRLRGREIEFVVGEIAHPPVVPPPDEFVQAESNEEVARISLRLPGALKESVERLANAEGVSVNAWLIRAISSAVDGGSSGARKSGWAGRGNRFTGFAKA